jgi:class 3 adenylate cyclase
MPDRLPSGTVTFLYTDIEGSATLWEREPKPMQAALDRHHAILHHAVAGCGGHVYKIIGDAFQVAFEVAGQAVQAAVAAQRALSAEAWPTSVPLRVRMGLHAGYATPWRKAPTTPPPTPSTAWPASWPPPTAGRSWCPKPWRS